ncbi:hypothetical protein [Undibacterium sp. Ji22W]|uniref:hypothetical protein n=1 Tax=Undibacterium sp. Ji22W TaxID=3413038 RepID=UPI003BF20E49
MTIYVNTYTASDGTKFDLYEFDIYKTYDPQTIREVKATQQAYYAAIKRDKDNAIKLEKELLTPKQLSDDDYFLLKKKENESRLQAIADREAEHAALAKIHSDYLESFPEIAVISCSALLTYSNEIAIWLKKNYQIIPESIECIPPSLYRASLSKTN